VQRSSPANANKVLRHVQAILRYAKELGVLRGQVPKTMKLKEPRRLPEAWSVDQVQLILAEALRKPGLIGELPANRWWYSLLLTLYYCGGRVGAVLATEPIDLSLTERTIILRAAAQKQRADQLLHLPDQVIAAVAPIYSLRRRGVWPWPHCRRHLFTQFRKLLDRAGVPCGQGRGGLFHKLRRTHASYMAAGGGNASWSLGHSSPTITRDHYLDPRIVGRAQVDLLPSVGSALRTDGSVKSGSSAWLLD